MLTNSSSYEGFSRYNKTHVLPQKTAHFGYKRRKNRKNTENDLTKHFKEQKNEIEQKNFNYFMIERLICSAFDVCVILLNDSAKNKILKS